MTILPRGSKPPNLLVAPICLEIVMVVKVFKRRSAVLVIRQTDFPLISNLSRVLPQLNPTKFKLEYLKSGFKCKKIKDMNIDNFLHHSSSTFFKFKSSLLLKYGSRLLEPNHSSETPASRNIYTFTCNSRNIYNFTCY